MRQLEDLRPTEGAAELGSRPCNDRSLIELEAARLRARVESECVFLPSLVARSPALEFVSHADRAERNLAETVHPDEVKTPTPVYLVAGLSLLLIVGGATAAAVQYASATSDGESRPDEGPTVSSREREEPREPRKPSEPRAELPVDTSCSGGCPFPGSFCEGSICRLAPGARWVLDADRILVRGASPHPTVLACIEPPGSPEHCTVGRDPQRAGDYTLYSPSSSAPLELATEQLDARAVTVKVGQERGRAPSARFVATEKLFSAGPLFRVQPEGSGIQFRIRPGLTAAPSGSVELPVDVPFEIPHRDDDRVSTIAGPVVVEERKPLCAYDVKLRERVILSTNCARDGSSHQGFPIPMLLKHYAGGLIPFDEIVVFQQQMVGNACDGGPLWILALRRDGSFEISPPVDFCGGKPPVLRPERGGLSIFLPGGPPNRGDGYLESSTWEFRAGRLTLLSDRP